VKPTQPVSVQQLVQQLNYSRQFNVKNNKNCHRITL